MPTRAELLADHFMHCAGIAAVVVEADGTIVAVDDVSAQSSQALQDHAGVLIRSEPTTIAGVRALTSYVAGLRQWEVPADDGWHQVLLGKANQGLSPSPQRNGRRLTAAGHRWRCLWAGG